jgi:hypothetical protein
MSNENDVDEVEDPIEFAAELGHLQDVCIDSVSVEIDDQVLYLVVDDLHANFESLPDYPGKRPCALIFLNVANFRIDVDLSDGLRISKFRVLETPDGQNPYLLEIDLNIGGSGRSKSISASFAALEIEDIDDQDD